MQTPQVLSSSPTVRPSRRYVSVGLVAALHVVVIYGLLVGINVVPNPIGRGPIETFVIPKAPPTHRLPPPSDPNLVRPSDETPPVRPDFQIEDSSGPTGPTITNPSLGGAGNVAPGPTLGPVALVSTHTIPPYPPMGIRLGHEGTVRLAIALDEQGNVISARVESSSGYEELDAAAIAWVKSHWRYQPAMRDGQPVPATTSANVAFKLNQIRG